MTRFRNSRIPNLLLNIFKFLCVMSNVKCFDKCFGPSTRASKFLTQMPQPIICFTIKVNSICGAGRDTWNLRHKFNSQGPALRILGLRVAISKAQGPISSVPCLRVSGSRVLGSLLSGLRVPGPGSQVLILHYAPSVAASVK